MQKILISRLVKYLRQCLQNLCACVQLNPSHLECLALPNCFSERWTTHATDSKRKLCQFGFQAHRRQSKSHSCGLENITIANVPSIAQTTHVDCSCVCACARQPRTQAFINSENLPAFFQVSSGKDVHAGLIRHMFQTRRCQNITLLQSVGYATIKTKSQLARFTAFDNQAHSSWARLAPLTNRCCADQGGPYKTQPCVNQCEP